MTKEPRVDYTSVLADLRARLDALEKERDTVVAALATLEQLVAVVPDAHHATGYTGLSMPDAVERALRDAGEPLPKAAIKAGLRAHGYVVAKDFGAKVYNALYRLKGERFYQDRTGRWGLKEWQGQNGARSSRRSPSR